MVNYDNEISNNRIPTVLSSIKRRKFNSIYFIELIKAFAFETRVIKLCKSLFVYIPPSIIHPPAPESASDPHLHHNQRRCKVAVILIKSFLLSRFGGGTVKSFTHFMANNLFIISDSFLLSVSSHRTLKLRKRRS